MMGVNFKGANLKNANFKGAYLQRANFQGANLEGAKFNGANLTCANIKGADINYGTDFDKIEYKGLQVDGDFFNKMVDANHVPTLFKKFNELQDDINLALQRIGDILSQGLLPFSGFISPNIQTVSYLYNRKKLMQGLHNNFKESNKLLVHGEGGMGKTELVSDYLLNYYQNHPGTIIWKFNAENPNTLLVDYQLFARRLQMPNLDSAQDVVTEIKGYIQNNIVRSLQKIILFFDNATNDSTLEQFDIENEQVKSIITSRKENAYKKAALLKIDPFSNDEVEEFFEEIKPDPSALAKLKEKTNSLPLALASAKSFLKCTRLAMPVYLKMLQQLPAKKNSASEHKQYFAAKLALNRLTEEELDLLYLCSFLGRDNIPLESISKYIQLQINSIDADDSWIKTISILNSLEEYALVTSSGYGEEASVKIVHDLVIDCIKLQRDHRQKYNLYLNKVLDLFTQHLFTKDTQFKEQFRKSLPISKQVEAFLADINEEKCDDMQKAQLAKLYDVLGFSYTQTGYPQTSVSILQHGKLLCEQVARISQGEHELVLSGFNSEYVCKYVDRLYYGSNGTIDNYYKKLKDSNIIDTYISILYTYGRTYTYLRKEEEYYIKYCKLAKELASMCLRDTEQKRLILHYALTETGGLLIFNILSKKQDPLMYAVERYQYFINDNSLYEDHAHNNEPSPLRKPLLYRNLSRAYKKLVAIDAKNKNYYISLAYKAAQDAATQKDTKDMQRQAAINNQLASLLITMLKENIPTDGDGPEKVEAFFNNTIEQLEKKEPGNYPLADAYYKKAKICFFQSKFSDAKDSIDKSKAIRDIMYKDGHPKRIKAGKLKSKIEEKIVNNHQ